MFHAHAHSQSPDIQKVLRPKIFIILKCFKGKIFEKTITHKTLEAVWYPVKQSLCHLVFVYPDSFFSSVCHLSCYFPFLHMFELSPYWSHCLSIGHLFNTSQHLGFTYISTIYISIALWYYSSLSICLSIQNVSTDTSEKIACTHARA